MSKTVDDLVKVYHDTYKAQPYSGVGHFDLGSRAGIAAVIRALREVICDNVYMTQECCGHGVPSRDGRHEECCYNPVHSITRDNLIMSFNEILGDAGEKVGTHGSPELDEDARKLEAMGQDPGMTLEELLAPATDPAPAVCVWVRAPYTALYSSCCDEDYLHNVTDSGMCHRCGLPIKFTEAKP